MSGEVTSLLKKYPFVQLNDRINALREVIQIIALKGLAKSGFFDHALFYGGTALRIFYNLDRFSEDLDFSLMRPNDTFRLARILTSFYKSFAIMISILLLTIRKRRKRQISSKQTSRVVYRRI